MSYRCWGDLYVLNSSPFLSYFPIYSPLDLYTLQNTDLSESSFEDLFNFTFLFSFIAFRLINLFSMKILLHFVFFYPLHLWVSTDSSLETPCLTSQLTTEHSHNESFWPFKFTIPKGRPFSQQHFPSSRVLGGQQHHLPSPLPQCLVFLNTMILLSSNPNVTYCSRPSCPRKYFLSLPAGPWTPVFSSPQWVRLSLPPLVLFTATIRTFRCHFTEEIFKKILHLIFLHLILNHVKYILVSSVGLEIKLIFFFKC